MTKPKRTPHATLRAPRLRVLAVGAGLIGFALLSACTGADQSNALRLVRQDRAAHGVRTIVIDSSTRTRAQSHALSMARAGRLYHSTLTLGSHQCAKAENIGYGGSITAVERAFMASSAHRANILNGR